MDWSSKDWIGCLTDLVKVDESDILQCILCVFVKIVDLQSVAC